MYIIHSVNKEEFDKEIESGQYGRASLDKCGFIHCSDLDTYHLVAPNFKDDYRDRLVLVIDTDRVNHEIKWEDGGGLDFPHIYGLLDKKAIVGIYPHLWSEDRTWIPNEELKSYLINGCNRKI